MKVLPRNYLDGSVGRLTGTKKIKRFRVDLLMSCAKVLREAVRFGPQFVVGLWGIVSAVIRWPLAVELTLQARNLQRKEARGRPCLGGDQGRLVC